jgi:myo-inositol-1(or 4)-monophosphatase
MSPPDLDPAEANALRSLRELAEQAARAGGTVARQSFGKPTTVRLKADRSEVSQVDEAAQRAVIDCIRAQRPDDGFVAEETLVEPEGRRRPPENEGVCWVIDPLDGTRNYIRGIPLYACSVGVMLHGFPIAGAIYVPPGKRLFSASRAEGFFEDGRPIAPRGRSPAPGRSPKPIIAIPSSFGGDREKAILDSWLGRVVVRNLGVASLHLALVAAGPFDAALMSDSRLWDIAAGWLLIDTIGGVMTTLAGQPVFPLDVAEYRGEALPGVAARDAEMLAHLKVD